MPQQVTNLHAHVYTPAGAEVGVLDSIWEWRSEGLLDAAGSWELTCWATDANKGLLVEGRRVDVYGTTESGEQLLSSGFVDGIEPHMNMGGSTLSAQGRDRLGELATRIIPNLNISERGWARMIDAAGTVRGRVRWLRSDVEDGVQDLDRPYAYDNDAGDPTQPDLTTTNTLRVGGPIWNDDLQRYLYEYIYIGFDARFDRVQFDVTDVGTVAGTLAAQYFNGEGWVGVADLVDGTADGGVPFAKDGTVTWTMPTDWERVTPTASAGSWFWVRLYKSGTRSNGFNVADVIVYSDVPTTNGVNLIMAYAPAGWKTSGYDATDEEAYDVISGLSVLTALERLREQVGGHYRAVNNAGTMEIEWFTSFDASGLTATGIGRDDATHVLLTELTPRTDATELVTRIYPTAPGVSLANTSRAAPAGYALDAAAGYIRNTAAETAYGRRDRVVEFDLALQQDDSIILHPEMAANALFDKALSWLGEHDTLAEFYDASARAFREVFVPGQTITLESEATVEGVKTLDYDELVNVVAVQHELDADDLLAASLEVATVERRSATDDQVIAEDIMRRRAASGAVIGSGGGGGTTLAYTGGADIDVSGTVIRRKGNSFLVFNASGALVAEYGDWASAAAAVTNGDVIHLPLGTIAGDVTLPPETEVVGRGLRSCFSGLVTQSDQSVLHNCRVMRRGDQAGALIGVLGPASGTAYLRGVFVDVVNAGGPAVGVKTQAGEVKVNDGSVWAEVTTVDADAYGVYTDSQGTARLMNATVRAISEAGEGWALVRSAAGGDGWADGCVLECAEGYEVLEEDV